MTYFTQYSAVKKGQKTGVRSLLRHLALDVFAVKDSLNGAASVLNKPRVQFLYIHHVFKDEEAGLVKLLQFLAKYHTFISYTEAVDRVLNGRIDKSYIAISSDDGFKNNLAAAKILNEFGAKACFFLNPGIIGEKDFEKIKSHCATRLNFPPVEFLDWDEVSQLQNAGHEIGSHTMWHINVAKTGNAEFSADCEESKNILTKHCGPIKHFAFPYGRFFHFSEAARKIVFESGYISCASAERGCHIASGNIQKEELCIRRDHVILDWKLSHIRHFLADNSRKASAETNQFPYIRG